jgi:hypothetical protein
MNKTHVVLSLVSARFVELSDRRGGRNILWGDNGSDGVFGPLKLTERHP